MAEKYYESHSGQQERQSTDIQEPLTEKELREALVRLEKVKEKAGLEYHDFFSAAFQAIANGKGNPFIANRMLEQLDTLLPDQNAADNPSRRLFFQKMGDLAKATVGVSIASQLMPLESALGMIHVAEIKIKDVKNWIETCEITNKVAGLPEFKFTFIPGDATKGERPIKGVHFEVKEPIDILFNKRGIPATVKIKDTEFPIFFNDKPYPIEHKTQFLDLWEQKYPDSRRVNDTRKNVAIIERHNVQLPSGEWAMPSEEGTISEDQGAVEFSSDNGTLLHFHPLHREYLTFSYEGETYLFHQDCTIEQIPSKSNPFVRRKSDGKIVKEFADPAEVEDWIADMRKGDPNFSLDQYDLVPPPSKMVIKRKGDNRIIKEFTTVKDWESYEKENAKPFTTIIVSSFEFLKDGPKKTFFHIDLKPLQDKNQSGVEVYKIYDITEELAKKAKGLSNVDEFYGGIQLSSDDPQYKFLAKKTQRYFQPVVEIKQ